METTVLGLRVLLALACVIGLIWVLARRAGWGKGRRRPAGPAVEVVGRQALGRHAGVAVIAVGNRRLLLGYGEQNVTMLTELAPAPVDLDAATAATPSGTAGGTTRTPMTLGDLAAAVLPTQRRRSRAAAAPVTVAAEVRGPSFEDALAAARATGAVDTPAAATAVATAAAPAATATAAAASATAAARAAALAAAAIPTTTPAPAATTPAELPLASGGALHGSVLAPSTWKQAVAALRERTVRR